MVFHRTYSKVTGSPKKGKNRHLSLENNLYRVWIIRWGRALIILGRQHVVCDKISKPSYMGFDLETRNANDRLVRSVKGNTTELEAIKAKQDTVINATIRDINNTASIGDGSSNATAVCLGYDQANGKGRALAVDGSGHLEVVT